VKKLAMRKFLGLITELSEETDTLAVVAFLFCKNYFTCAELWIDEVYEMITVEVKGRDPTITLEIVGTYRAPNGDMQLFEKLADWTGYMERTTKRSIIGGDLNLP